MNARQARSRRQQYLVQLRHNLDAMLQVQDSLETLDRQNATSSRFLLYGHRHFDELYWLLSQAHDLLTTLESEDESEGE